MKKLCLLLVLLGCRPSVDEYVDAARTVTRRYTHSQFARWQMQMTAAGTDCSVLIVRATAIPLDDALVDAVHDGSGPYAVDGRGMEKFASERRFRAVVYRDLTQRVWRRGTIDYDESLIPCR
jgi:hypothetical protein